MKKIQPQKKLPALKTSKEHAERVDAAMSAAIVLKSLEQEAAPLLKQLNKIAIDDADTYTIKSEKLDLLKQLGKQAEAKEKSLTEPLDKVIVGIKELFKPFRSIVSQAVAVGKTEMIDFQNKMEHERQKIKADLDNGKIAKVSTAARKIEATEISAPTSKVRREWKLKIVDVGDIPREYLIPNEAKIREAFKAGKKVTGCEWKQEINVAI